MNENQSGLTHNRRRIGVWDIHTLEFTDPLQSSLCVDVFGTIVNAIVEGVTGRKKQQLWKAKIALAVMKLRGEEPWNPHCEYSISIGLSFFPAIHSYYFDVENYIKPILDAIAAGLFSTPQTEFEEIELWNYDDSNFKTLLIHRLPDADFEKSEGIAICVSSKV